MHKKTMLTYFKTSLAAS